VEGQRTKLSPATGIHPAVAVRCGDREVRAQPARTFGDLTPNGFGVIEDSGEWLQIVRNRASADRALVDPRS